MPPEWRAVVWAFVGSVVVAVGGGTATIAAFVPSLPVGPDTFAVRTLVVGTGFAVFFAGYHVSQAGTHRNPDEPLGMALLPVPVVRGDDTGGAVEPFAVFRGVSVLLGVFGLGAGLRLFAVTISAWDPTLGLLAGAVCAGGYICGHIGVNGVLI